MRDSCSYVEVSKLPIDLIREYLSAFESTIVQCIYIDDDTTSIRIMNLTRYIYAQHTQISTSLFGELDEERRCVGKGQRVMDRGGMSSALEPLNLDREMRKINVSHPPLFSTYRPQSSYIYLRILSGC